MFQLMKRLLCLLFCSFALPAAPAQTETSSDPTTLVHTVRRGESLEFLATRFGVTPEQLSALNHDADTFYAGMRVTLPFPHELRGKSDGTIPLDDDILSELYRYRDLCIEADSLFAHSSFSSAHDRYDEAIQHYDGYFDCSGAKYARAVCSYHAHDWETALREFDRVISGTSCSEDVLAVAKAYREVCSQHEEQIRQRRFAAEEARKERRRERWRNIGAGLVQAAGMVAQAYVQSKYETSGGGGAASSGDFSSSTSSSSTSSSTAGSGGATPATRGKLCQKMSAGDNAHCGGNGVCSRCNGNKRYYDTSFGNARWVPCGTCGQTGKCPSCHGTGYRN